MREGDLESMKRRQKVQTQMRETVRFLEISVDHLFLISKFKLDVDSPYPKPSRETFETKPDRVNYPSNHIRYKHYGKSIEKMIEKANAMEDGELKFAFVEAIANQMKKSYINWTPSVRGLHKIPRLLIQSHFPYAMLRAWKYIDPKAEFIVYPEKKGTKNIPSKEIQQAEEDMNAAENTKGLFRDHREFQKTDSPNKIDWKLSLKHQKYFVKNFESGDEKKVLIEWEMTSMISNFEDRVSQLALWIDLSHKNNELYNLKINQDQTGYSSHINHYKSCMEKLALLKIEDTV